MAESIQPVLLAPSNIGDLVGEIAQVSGWGPTNDTNTANSPVLNVVDSTILDNEVCQYDLGSEFIVYETVVCMDGTDSKTLCNVSIRNFFIMRTCYVIG